MGRYDKYSADVRRALGLAREEAQRLRHRLIGTEHLLLGLLKLQQSLIEGFFAALHIAPLNIIQALDFVIGHGTKALLSEPTLNVYARAALARAEEIMHEDGCELIEAQHLFLAILEESNGIGLGVLESFDIDVDKARERLALLAQGGYEQLMLSTYYHTTYSATPVLNSVSRDLTLAALENTLDPLIGRENELERTMQILVRRSKNNPVLLGPAGVGKTAIAEGLALRIVQNRVPEQLAHHRVVSLDVGLLSVGTRFRGDLEERLTSILKEIVDNPGIIVVVDELQTLVQTSVAEGSVNVGNLFKPMLARRELQCIGATTLDEYRKTIESDPALERRFQPVMVSETTPEETMRILRALAPRYGTFHRVRISEDALRAAVRLSTRYIQDRYQPDKAIDLLDEAAARARVARSTLPEAIQKMRLELFALQREKEQIIEQRDFPHAAQLLTKERELYQRCWREEQGWQDRLTQESVVVEEQDIAAVVSAHTGIPLVQIVGEERVRLLHLEQELQGSIVGQQDAVHAVARAIRRARADVRDPKRPIGSFLFVGPSGVGKTELARTLARTLFGDEHALLKLDMSEFMDRHQVSRLVSAPPGYVGYDQAGQLTESVRRRPYSVVLFDEIEKAHPYLFDLLLQILEDGRLTDAHGRVVDFKHTLVILTSNIGSIHDEHMPMIVSSHQKNASRLQDQIYKHMEERIHDGLKATFRPELLNRIDEIVIFRPLEQPHLLAIADMMLAQTKERLEKQAIGLQVSEEARTFLIEQGVSSDRGARTLRRTIQHFLEDMLADVLLRNECGAGDTVIVDIANGLLQARTLRGAGVALATKRKHVAA
jgi:ATP-dependent Clp protease ATP-binding subunit ClpC